MAKLILKYEASTLKEIPLRKPNTSIGRVPGNDVVIDNLAVSGHHAKLLVEEGRFLVEALNSLNKALEYNPTYGDAYILKGYLLLEYLFNPDEALEAANQAVKYAANNQDSHYTLGLILIKKQRYQEAEQAMVRALALNPSNADVLLSLGDLYAEELKDRKKAVEAYTKYLATGGAEARAKAYLEKAGGAPAKP